MLCFFADAFSISTPLKVISMKIDAVRSIKALCIIHPELLLLILMRLIKALYIFFSFTALVVDYITSVFF